MTFETVDRASTSRICVWGATTGEVQAQLEVTAQPSCLYLSFDLELRFYSYHQDYRVPYDICLSPGANPTYTIIRHDQQPWTVQLDGGEYEVECSRQWVVHSSERICWIPPGYVRSAEGGYCWAGSNALVMIGEDRILGKLDFSRSQLRL